MKRNFYYHVGIPGHLKVKNYKELYSEKPQSMIYYGVWKSLKSNRARVHFMKNLEVYKGMEVPYDFLPNFTPTPNIDKSDFFNLEVLKNSKLIGMENMSKEDLPDQFKDMEVDVELATELQDKKLNYNIPKKVMKKIKQYNLWVDD